jgi:hypothetical protein
VTNIVMRFILMAFRRSLLSFMKRMHRILLHSRFPCKRLVAVDEEGAGGDLGLTSFFDSDRSQVIIRGMQSLILVVLAGLFVALLVFRLVRGYLVAKHFPIGNACMSGPMDPELVAIVEEAKRTGRTREALRAVERRAAGAGSPSMRAAHHCAAGNLSLNHLKRPALAVGFYLRALREDPTCVHALMSLREILTAQKRWRRLERTYWEVLGRLDDGEVGSEIWTKCWSGLSSVYSVSPRTLRRADAIRKMLTETSAAPESDEVEEPVSGATPR